MKRSTPALLVAMLLGVPAHSAEPLKMTGFDFAPFSIVGGETLSGVAVDLTKAMAQEAGVDITGSSVGSVKRVLETATEPNVVVPMLTRTPERENKVQWIGKWSDDTNCFFTKKEAPVTTLEEAKKLPKVAVNAGGVTEKVLLENGFTNLEPVSTNSFNYRKVEADRAPAWFTSELVSRHTVLKEKGDLSRFVCSGAIKKPQYWLVVSQGTSKEVVDKLRARFAEWEKSGRIAKAIANYSN